MISLTWRLDYPLLPAPFSATPTDSCGLTRRGTTRPDNDGQYGWITGDGLDSGKRLAPGSGRTMALLPLLIGR